MTKLLSRRASRVSRRRKGLLVVVSAGSGAGKSTLCRQLMKRRRNMVFSISATTRLPRPGEKDGKDYFFVTDAAFKTMRRRGELAEWAIVHGEHSYGTPKAAIEKMRSLGKDVLLDIDVQGALQVKRRYPDAVLIFITTPTLADLERRLRRRSSETEAEIQQRLADARRELEFVGEYDYNVVNDRIPRAVRELESIIESESRKIS
jgi:guanylate kinase